MTESSRGTDRAGRRPRRFLTPQEKYEIWLQLVRDESLIAHAADQAVVDRSTIMKLRAVAKQGAFNALGRVTAGVRQRQGPTPELAAAQAEGPPAVGGADRDGRAADPGGAERAFGLSGRVPRRVDVAEAEVRSDLPDV